MEVLFLILIVFGFAAHFIYKSRQYKKTAYYQVTHNSYSSIKYDKGKHGEYLAYKRLQHFEDRGGKFLFNVYIPKWNDETTEIDMLLICSKGLFVFESKNYSGWIFGNERNTNWTQTLPIGRGRSHKERFYNPIMQNATHVKHLRRVVGVDIPMHSIIVFSDHCILKDVTIHSGVPVIRGHEISSTVDRILNQNSDFLTEMQITMLYIKLYPYTQVGGEVKERHIESNRFTN